MWQAHVLKKLGLVLEPRDNSFTYTFPPPYFAKRRGVLRRPATYGTGVLNDDISLYLHIPFCEMDCSFCSLHRTAHHDSALITRYLGALKLEMRLLRCAGVRGPVSSVYIGGGTPTILPASALGDLLDAVTDAFGDVTAPCEVSVECAPSPRRNREEWKKYIRQLTDRKCFAVNRLSFGLQAGDAAALRHMGRVGGQSAATALLLAADETIDNYNADFLLNYPGTGPLLRQEEWVDLLLKWIDQRQAEGVRLPSLSLYQLWDVLNIAVGRARRVHVVEERDLLERKWRLQEGLFARGFSPGIISTVVRQAQYTSRCFRHRHLSFRHVGCGSGSYSILPNELAQRSRDIGGYIEECEKATVLDSTIVTYTLTPDEVEVRRLIMGLRSCDWIPVPSLPAALETPTSAVQETMQRMDRLADAGLILKQDGRRRLADSAFFLGNEIATYLHPASHARKD